MDESGPTVSILFFFVLLVVDFLFYGFFAAVRKLNYGVMKEAVETTNDKKSRKLLQILEEPESYVNTLQLVITLSNIIMGSIYVRQFYLFIQKMLVESVKGTNGQRFLEAPFRFLIFAVAGALLIYLILSVGVLVPKKVGEKYAEGWAYVFVEPIWFIAFVLKPLTNFITITSNVIVRIFGVNPNMDFVDVTEEEIISMVNEGHEQGVLDASEAEMITNIFEFSDKEAREIMTHRSNIIGIDGNTTLRECVDFMLHVGKNSRYPVYIDNIDHIIGIIHLKDAFAFLEKGTNAQRPIKNIKNLVREVKFVPETKNIDRLFRSMQATKTHMVIIVDEYGQTSGLVAMEDILEEIVGNILDEFDEDEVFVKAKGANQYEIDGLTPLEELEELLQIRFREEEFETLNGLMTSWLERVPEEGEQFEIEYEGVHFKVLSVENRVIKKVLVTKMKEIQEGEN